MIAAQIAPANTTKNVTFEMLLPDVPFQRLTQFPVPEHHEPRIGHLAHHECGSVDEVVQPLLRNESRDRADNGRPVRQVERAVHVGRLRSGDPLYVHAFVDDSGS